MGIGISQKRGKNKKKLRKHDSPRAVRESFTGNLPGQLLIASVVATGLIALVMNLALPGTGLDAALACGILLVSQLFLFLLQRWATKDSRGLITTRERDMQADSDSLRKALSPQEGPRNLKLNESEKLTPEPRELVEARITAAKIFEEAGFTPIKDLRGVFRKVSSVLKEQRELLDALTGLAQRGDPVRNVREGVAVIKTAHPIMELARKSGGDVVRSHDQLSAILDVLIERGQERPKSRDKIRDLALSWRRAIALGQKELPQLQSRCEELQRNLTSAHSDVEALRSELGELKDRHQREISDLSRKLSASGQEVQRNASAAQQLRTEVLKLREELEAQAAEVQRLTSLQSQELEWADQVADDLALVVDAYSVLTVVTSYLQLCWKDESEEDRRRWLSQAIQPVKSALDQRNQRLLETCGERAFDLYRACFFGVAEVGESTFEVLDCTTPDEESFQTLRQKVRTKASSNATSFVVMHLPADLQSSVSEILQ